MNVNENEWDKSKDQELKGLYYWSNFHPGIIQQGHSGFPIVRELDCSSDWKKYQASLIEWVLWVREVVHLKENSQIS